MLHKVSLLLTDGDMERIARVETLAAKEQLTETEYKESLRLLQRLGDVLSIHAHQQHSNLSQPIQ